MKRLLNFKWLLLSFVLSIASINQVWAGDLSSLYDPYFYYYNSDDWNKCMVLYGRRYDSEWDGYNPGHYTKALNMNAVSGTKLYYVFINDNWNKSYNDIAVLNAEKTGSSWGDGREKIESRWSGSTHTNNHILNYRLDYHRTYLWDGKTASTITCVNDQDTEDGYTSLNHSQTVKKYTYTYDLNGGSQSYTKANVNSGTVTISAYKMTAHGTASNENNSATIDEASETEISVDAAYTGVVTLTATPAEGYYFVGWYTSGGSLEDSRSTYTYNAPNSTKELHARFAPCLPKTLYLNAQDFTDSGTKNWANDNAVFFAKISGDPEKSDQYVEFNMTPVATNYYSVTLPDGKWNTVEYLRVDPNNKNNLPSSGIWNRIGDKTADGVKNCISVTGWTSSGSLFLYSPKPCIIGSMNNYSPDAAKMSLKDGVYTYAFTDLEAHKAYEFKILYGTDRFGLTNNVWTSSVSNYTIYNGNYQIRLCTAGTGTYTFTYNTSGNQLSVSYPTVTHPSVDYCYIRNYDSWSNTYYIHFPENSSAGIAKTTEWGTQLHNKTEIDGVYYYYYSPGDYPKIHLSENGDGSDRTGEQTPDYGKSLLWSSCVSSAWSWCPFSFTVTLTEQVTTTSAPSDPSVEFNGTAPSDITSPTSSAYPTFGGYYTQAGGEGLQIINASGVWQASKSGYTDGSTKWIHEGGTAELFGKWSQSVTLNKHNGSDNASVTMTYNSSTHPSITNPGKTGYTFAGWYTAESGGTLIIDTEGHLQNSTSYTDGSGKWTNSGSAPTLHAQYTEDTHTVTLANGGHGHVKINSSTVTSVSGIGIATASGDITAVADEGYHFVNWTGDIGSGVTLASGSATSETITINATAESKTITANFAANTYEVAFNANYPSGNRFNNGGSMSNESFTYDASAKALTSNAFECEGYNFAGWAKDDPSNAVSYTDGQSVSNITSTHNATVQLYAKWDDDHKYYFARPNRCLDWDGACNTSWTNVNNWTKRKLPSIEDTVYLYDLAVVKDTTVAVANIWIMRPGTNDKTYDYKPVGVADGTHYPDGYATDSSYYPNGYLEIEYSGAVLVTDSIRNIKSWNGVHEPTSTGTIWIMASGVYAELVKGDTMGLGGVLITKKEHIGNLAMVEYSTRACKKTTLEGEEYINQYFGIPFKETSVYSYYGMYLYAYSAATNSFSNISSGDMTPFDSYMLISTNPGRGTNFEMRGELMLPGTSGTKTLTLTRRDADVVAEKPTTNMFANSWTGPLHIGAFDGDDFTGCEATFYLFNAGSKQDSIRAEEAGKKDQAGQWTTLSVSAVKGDKKLQQVLPPMQAFLVVATGEVGSEGDHMIILDYKKHVYDPALDSIENGTEKEIPIVPVRAPKRTLATEEPEIMRFFVEGESGRADHMYMYLRDDFTENFDNCWDGRKITGGAFTPQLFAVTNDGWMALNAIPDAEGTVVGFRAGTEDNSYTFTFEYEGADIWYLNDLEAQTSTMIENEGSYSFTATEGNTYSHRFIISATPISHMPTGFDNVNDGSKARKLMIDGTLYIIRSGRMYNAEGTLVK